MAGSLHAVNVSDGGVPKLARVQGLVLARGLEGDRQRDLEYHGGPDRAVCLYSLELLQALRAEGHPVAAGCMGENFTVSGIEWNAMQPGARLQVGEVLLVLTDYAAPCTNLAPFFVERRFSRVSQKKHPGWSRLYARVLREGTVRVGDAVALG